MSAKGEDPSGSESPYWALFANNPHPMFIFDAESLLCLAANDAAVARYGYSRDELARMRIPDFRGNSAENEAFHRAYASSVMTNDPGPTMFPGTWRHKKKDGTMLDVQVWRMRFSFEGRAAVVAMPIDVTAERRATAALQDVEQRWRSLVETSPDFVFTTDSAGRIEFLNRALAPHSADEFVGRMFHEFAPPERREELVAAFEAVRSTNSPRFSEGGGTFPDGTLAGCFSSRYVPIRRDGEFVGMLSVTSDVTERRRVEAALRASEERFRALIENTSDAVALVDEGSIFRYASPGATRALGYHGEELLGTSCFDRVHEDERARLRDAFDELLRTTRGSARTEYRCRHKDGSWRWIDCVATNLLDEPSIRAVVLNYRDVTQQKHSNEELRESEERYRMLFDASPLPMFVYDVETLKFLAVSDTAVRTYGYSRQEFLALTIMDIRPADDRARVLAMLPGLRGTHTHGNWRHLRRDGSLLYVEVTSHSITFDGRKARLVAAQDVSERHRLEEQLRQSQKMEAIGLLAGGVAHDFNNLLGIILGASELAKRGIAGGRSPTDHLDAITTASQRAADLTKKLLAFSRKQVLRVETRDLGDVLVDFTSLIGRIVGEDVELIVKKAPVSTLVRVDASQLEQVLLNLCTNARQAMPHGGTLTIEVHSAALDDAFVATHPWARRGHYGELRVTDTGVGMDPETRARVFEPFFTTKAQGTGLGLAMVYGIVQQHQGFIAVHSTLGEGTTFCIFLPLASPSARVLTPFPPRALADVRGGKETLLIAEDEAPLRDVLARMLEGLGYTVLRASNGEEAAREFANRPGEIALVILDVVMPKVGGPESYRRMKAIDANVKVIFTTGYAPGSSELADLVQDGGLALLDKPFKLQELANKVRELLDA